ncbi:unnamed protein product [Arctogadus glacialis]
MCIESEGISIVLSSSQTIKRRVSEEERETESEGEVVVVAVVAVVGVVAVVAVGVVAVGVVAEPPSESMEFKETLAQFQVGKRVRRGKEWQRTESGVKVLLMTPKVECLQGCAAFARCHPDLDALASNDHV